MENSETELFIHADKKIEKTREDVSEVIRSILGQGQKLDQLSERINEGISKTAYKTFEKVNEIGVAMNDMKHSNEKRDIKIDELEKTDNLIRDDLKAQRNNWNTFVRVFIFGVAAAILMTFLKLNG